MPKRGSEILISKAFPPSLFFVADAEAALPVAAVPVVALFPVVLAVLLPPVPVGVTVGFTDTTLVPVASTLPVFAAAFPSNAAGVITLLYPGNNDSV